MPLNSRAEAKPRPPARRASAARQSGAGVYFRSPWHTARGLAAHFLSAVSEHFFQKFLHSGYVFINIRSVSYSIFGRSNNFQGCPQIIPTFSKIRIPEISCVKRPLKTTNHFRKHDPSGAIIFYDLYHLLPKSLLMFANFHRQRFTCSLLKATRGPSNLLICNRQWFLTGPFPVPQQGNLPTQLLRRRPLATCKCLRIAWVYFVHLGQTPPIRRSRLHKTGVEHFGSARHVARGPGAHYSSPASRYSPSTSLASPDEASIKYR